MQELFAIRRFKSCLIYCKYYVHFFNPHLRLCLLILEREERRERERERNIDVREKHQSVASRMLPDQGSNLQPRYGP